MTLQPFKDEELNYFKFASLVLNEFPKALRQTFNAIWNNSFGHLIPWDDSISARNYFLAEEGGKTEVPTDRSYEEWDCTALFQATICARSFALRDSKGYYKTLSDLYVKPRKLASGKFHTSVISPWGNKAETFALAIDQLRLLRNTLCHSISSEIDKPKFNQFVQLSKDAFKALGVRTDPIDVIGSLTESDFPTKEVRKLQQAMKEETQACLKFLEGMSSEIDELKALLTAMKEGNASKEDIASLEQKISDLGQELVQGKQDTKPSPPKSCLPPMVPHFTGRQKECEKISGHVISGSIRIVSIWGSPGFGKTSVAIAVGHHLHSQGLPVYFLSLRGLQSTADLASKFLSLFGRTAATCQQNQQSLSIDNEIFRLFSEMSDPFALILDNADDLLSGGSGMKDDFTQLLQDIFRRTQKVTFIISTRESLDFLNVQFQGHQAVRISPLNAPSSQNLVNEMLPNANASDCKRVTQMCGHVPLAIKLLCSPFSEDNAELIQVLDDLERSLDDHSIGEMLENSLDNPDFPSHLRLKHLFDTSFQRLCKREKEALVSLCVLPDSFDPAIAATVLGIPRISVAKMVLRNLWRKSLLESSAEPRSFSVHPLIRSFGNERGEHEMKETVLKSKSRLNEFYICRFKELNERFLTGHSMSAFIDFYKDEQSITQSLIEGCSDSQTAKSVFEVLVKAELFLYSVYWREESNFNKLYDSALNVADTLKENVFYRKLLVSKALYHVTWSTIGNTTNMLSKAKDIKASCPPLSVGDKVKHLCYSGINQLVNGKTTVGVQCLKEALSSMDDTPEQKVLRIIAFQILAIFHHFENDFPRMSQCYSSAVHECRKMGYAQLLIIPEIESTEMKVGENRMTQEPLKVVVLSLVSEATEHLPDSDKRRSIRNAAQEIAKNIEKPPVQRSVGLFTFQRNATIIVQHLLRKVEGDTVNMFMESTTSCHEEEINQFKRTQSLKMARRESTANDLCSIRNSAPSLLCSDGTAKLPRDQRSRAANNYHLFQDKQHGKPKDHISVLWSKQCAKKTQELSGKEQSSTSDNYHLLGATRRENSDSSSAPQCPQRPVGRLATRLEILRGELSNRGDTYDSPRVTQHPQGNLSSTLQSAQRTVSRRKSLRKKRASKADSYQSLGVTQHAQGDFTSALQSTQLALDIRLKLFGEQHTSTADSYQSLGVIQHALCDLTSALQSTQLALDIRLKLFGEEHSSIADSYQSLGATQHAQGDFTSALQSTQRALDIRVKLFGKEHSSTALSYYLLGIAQHDLGDFSSARQSIQRALDIRLRLFGEEHLSTADSYDLLSVILHEQGELSSSLQSAQHALSIRRRLLGEEHSSTADSYHSLGDTQHAQGDFTSALQSKQRALDIRITLFGEQNTSTADSYHSLGDTQQAQGNSASALQTTQRALDIRAKLLGKEHSSTALSYYSLGIAQHNLGDFSSALQSIQRALDIRLKLLGEEHSSTADSYHSLGIIQHALGHFSAARQSKERALDLRRVLFGERHPSTAQSYDSLGDTQYAQALHCKQRARNIRLELFGEEY